MKDYLYIIILSIKKDMQSYILVYTDGSFHKNIGVGACVIPYFSNYFYLSGSVASPYEA